MVPAADGRAVAAGPQSIRSSRVKLLYWAARCGLISYPAESSYASPTWTSSSTFSNVASKTTNLLMQRIRDGYGNKLLLASTIKAKEQKQPPRYMLVVTHHVPSSSRSLGPENSSEDSSTNATELISGADGTNVSIWAFGHTQYATEQSEGKARVLSNQRADM